MNIPDNEIYSSESIGEYLIVIVERQYFVKHRKRFTNMKKTKHLVDDERYIVIWIPK